MLLTIALACLTAAAVAAGDELVDPHDMLGERKPRAPVEGSALLPPLREHSSMLPGLPSSAPFVRESCPMPSNPDAIHMRRYVRMLLQRLKYEGEGTETYELKLSLSQLQFETLQRFALPNAGSVGIHDAASALEQLIVSVTPTASFHATAKWLASYGHYLAFAAQVFLCVSTIISVFILIVKAWYRFHWRVLLVVMVTLFLISIPWTWMHLYKSKLAERMHRSDMEKPRECDPERMSVFALWWGREQKCLKFYEDMVVDPLWEVKPTEAFAVTVVEFIWKPLEKMGRPLGIFLSGAMEHVPWLMRPFVLIFLVAVAVFVAIIMRGYRFRFTPLVVFEPAVVTERLPLPPALEAMGEQNQAMKNAIEQVHSMLSKLVTQYSECQRREAGINQAIDALHLSRDQLTATSSPSVHTAAAGGDVPRAVDSMTKRPAVATIGQLATDPPDCNGNNGQHCSSSSSSSSSNQHLQAPTRIKQLDHLVLTVKDIKKTVDFYSKLGMRLEVFKGTRKALHFGSQKINLHEHGSEYEPKARYPTPGSADLCFVSGVPLSRTMSLIETQGMEVSEGPVDRTGACGPMTSIYLRDPDGNLVELAHYPQEPVY